VDARRSFSTLRPRLASLIFAFVLGLPLATASPAETLQLNTAKLHFGETTVQLDNDLLLGVRGVAKSVLGTRREFDISDNETVQVALPTQVLASFSPPCEAVRSILMIRGALPRRVDNPLFNGLRPRKTDFQGISQLVPANGLPLLELYQFESDQLRDFWGDQISFYKSGPLLRLKLQISRDLRIDLGTSATDCLFEKASVFVTQLRAFVLGTIKSHP
jgi:hypothetical protein